MSRSPSMPLAAARRKLWSAATIVTAIAWAYVHYGSRPQLGIVLRTVKPIIIVVVLQAMWSLGKTALRNTLMAAIAIGIGELCLGQHYATHVR